MRQVITAAGASNGARSGNPALVVYRPLVEKVVAALGALVTHQIAYLLASLLVSTGVIGAVENTDHGHLSVQWAIVAPAAVASVCGFILWQLRNLGFRTALSVRYLSMMVVAFFLIQETVEGLAVGRSVGATMVHPAIMIGVLVAPLVAWLMSKALAGVTELAARFINVLSSVTVPTVPAHPMPVPVRCSSVHLGGRSRPRAPPSRLRI